MARRYLLACCLLLLTLAIGAAWLFLPWIFSPHYTLQVASGPPGSDAQAFVAAFKRQLAEERPRLRLEVVQGEPLLIKLDALHDLAAEFDGGRLLPKSHAEGLQRENSVAHDAGFEPSIHHAAKRTPEARTGQPANKQLPLMG